MQKKNAKKRGLFQEAKVSGAGARTGEAPDAIESQGTVNLTIYCYANLAPARTPCHRLLFWQRLPRFHSSFLYAGIYAGPTVISMQFFYHRVLAENSKTFWSRAKAEKAFPSFYFPDRFNTSPWTCNYQQQTSSWRN